MKVKMDIDGPINLVGDYTVGGKVLVLPITGAGKANITISEFLVFTKMCMQFNRWLGQTVPLVCATRTVSL